MHMPLPQHVLLCTRTVHDQLIRRHLYSGIFKDPLNKKCKINLKIDNIHKSYVLCLKLEYFFKSCKTLPLNATNGREMSVKKHYMESQHCVPGHFRLAQSIQVECMSSLCSLWFILNINKNNLSRETLTFIHVQSQFYIRPLYTLYTVQNRIIFLFSGYINTYGEIEIIDVNIQIYSF